jgi:hypothetical protein
MPSILDIATIQQLKKADLIAAINHLIVHDFEQLVSLLYRIDVNESKIKLLLQNNPDTNAAELMADAIIQRLAEKQQAKAQYQSPPPTDEEERW